MPSFAELQCFVGEELGQISIDPFSVQFRFDRLGLTVEFDIEHVESDGNRHLYGCRAQEGPPLLLHRLLQKQVISVEREDLAFNLNFADRSILIIRTELGPHECGQLYRLSGATEIIVF